MKYKVGIAMPVDGHPDDALVHYAVQRAQRMLANVMQLADLADGWVGSMDLVRARDRQARMALFESDISHVLHWDSDVLPEDLRIIDRMLETGHDCVGAPYRRKKQKEEYPWRPLDVAGHVVNGCLEVRGLAFGFMLTSRACLEQMWNGYLSTRWYFDVAQQASGKSRAHLTVSMFDLCYTEVAEAPDGQPFRVKLSEDYSFCESYRAIGGKVHMFVGEGAPVGHMGTAVYRGTREGLAGAG